MTCASAGEQATFGCLSRFFCFCFKPPCPPCHPLCLASTDTAFTYSVNCGALGTTTTCGTCLNAGQGDGTGTANSYTSNVQQTCH
jgi:hypothetical protein